MDLSGYVPWLLALATFGLVLVFAIWQRSNVSKAKTEHHHTAMTEGHPELRRVTALIPEPRRIEYTFGRLEAR